MDKASSDGNTDILEKIKKSGIPLKYSKYAMDLASKNRNMYVLEWWKNSGLELKYTNDIYILAKNEETSNWLDINLRNEPKNLITRKTDCFDSINQRQIEDNEIYVLCDGKVPHCYLYISWMNYFRVLNGRDDLAVCPICRSKIDKSKIYINKE